MAPAVFQEVVVKKQYGNSTILMVLKGIALFAIPIAIGTLLSWYTFATVLPSLRVVTATVIIDNPDYGAYLPDGSVCFTTKGIPAVSDAVRYGMRILYQSGVNRKIGTVVKVEEGGAITVEDSRGNQTVIKNNDYIGVVSATIPYVGKWFRFDKIS